MPAKKNEPIQQAKKITKINSSPYSFQSAIEFANKNFGLFLIGGFIFIAGFFIGSIWTENELLKSGGVDTKPVVGADAQPSDPSAQGPDSATIAKVPEISNDDHIRGNSEAKIFLVEYSDFECPFCARFHPTMLQVMDEYPNDVAWVLRHYPLSFHPQAQKAAEGSECVAKQLGNDGFWVYVDHIFDTNTKNGGLVVTDIQDSAQAAGANMTAFNDCLDSDEMAQKVNDSLAGGAGAGVSGTPGTIVVTKDGGQELISGALPFAQIKIAIDKYLK